MKNTSFRVRLSYCLSLIKNLIFLHPLLHQGKLPLASGVWIFKPLDHYLPHHVGKKNPSISCCNNITYYYDYFGLLVSSGPASALEGNEF